MKHTEKDILIEKVKKLPPEDISKVLIFIAGLEAGGEIKGKSHNAMEYRENNNGGER